MFIIRPFKETDADYEALAALEYAVWPEFPDTVEEWKHRDRTRDPQYLFQRLFVELDGEVVAVGEYLEPWWSMKPGKYRISVNVHPDHQRKGIGTYLYNHLMELVKEHDPVVVVTNTREDRVDALRFLTKRGFKQLMRYPISHLDVASFDATPFAGVQIRVEEDGIAILSLAHLATRDLDWKHKLWDLEWELLQDVPSPDPLTRQSFESFERQTLGNPAFYPSAQFIALDDDRWVGMSGLWMALGDPDKLYTGLTGVLRSHRRKGIATAMKVRAIGFAQEHGVKIIETDNEENNPMYLLNLKLGFQPQPAILDFEKWIR
jgi:mycothiol synthase